MQHRMLLLLLPGLVLGQDCSVGDKIDCGYMGIDQQGCQDKGCCWQPTAQREHDTPWCFYPDGGAGGGARAGPRARPPGPERLRRREAVARIGARRRASDNNEEMQINETNRVIHREW